MLKFQSSHRSLILSLVVLSGVAASPMLAQDAMGDKAKPAEKMTEKGAAKTTQGKEASSNELINDFVHYTLIDRADLAKSMGQALLDRAVAGADLVGLVDRSVGYRRFTQAVIRAQKQADLEPVASKLLALYESGKLSASRSPDSIAANIKQLTGTQRERLFARERLLGAGEYAVPQLLGALLDNSNPGQQAEVRQMLSDMGRQAIAPLSAALPNLSGSDQELVLHVLGDIPYPASAPFLFAVAAAPSTPQAGKVAEDAARRVTGSFNTSASLSDRFVDLANEYGQASPSLISFPDEATQPMWVFTPGAGSGLTFQSIDTRVFPSTMALHLCERALQLDPTNQRAVSSWIAANFTREIRTPEGYVNPGYAKDRREAMYYAVAAGPAPAQVVLARALDANDAPLARRALAALEKTAGGTTLWSRTTGSGAGASAGDRSPLLEALRFPNRRVQYDAALALGSAGQREAFPGSDQVVRILASATRDAGLKHVIVLSSDTERQASMSDLFRAQGYTPLPPAARLEELAQAIADAPAIDLIVTDLPSQSTQDTIERAHSDQKLRATPVLALLTAQGAKEQSARYSRDPLVRVARAGLGPKEISAAAEQLVVQASGGELKADEATLYKSRALAVLRDIAVSRSTVMNINDAQSALVASLVGSKGEMRARIAEVLSYIPQASAQNALMDAAVAAEGAERIAMLGRLTDSAKRGGNKLDAGNLARLSDLARTGKGEEATAAAALMGALALPNDRIVPLILNTNP